MVGAMAGAYAGVSVLSSIGDYRGRKKADKALRKQADLTYETRMEQMRRRETQMRQQYGGAKTDIGAAGVTGGGTPSDYMRSMRNEFSKELDWMKRAADMERDAIKSGQTGGRSNFVGALGGAVRGLTGAYGIWRG